MTKHFNSLGEMAIELIEVAAAEYLALEHGLDAVLGKIRRDAQAEIGKYQGSVGPFPAWEPLADSTQDERVRLGFTADDPLLRTGELQESIEKERQGLEGVVGSKSDVMVFHEFGTSKMPPRPVLGPAAFKNREWIERLAAAAVVAGFVGGDAIHRSLGYDFKTFSAVPGEK